MDEQKRPVDNDAMSDMNDAGQTPPLPVVTCVNDSSADIKLLLGLIPLVYIFLSLPFINILSPWIVWLCVRKSNPQTRTAYRSVMNMQISWSIWGGLLSIFLIASIVLTMAFTVSAADYYLKELDQKNKMEKVVAPKKSSDEACAEKQVGKSDTNNVVATSSVPEDSVKTHKHADVKVKDGLTEFACVTGMQMGTINAGIMLCLFGVLGVFFLFGLAWLVLTIVFAVKVRNNDDAKPPLTIRFFR